MPGIFCGTELPPIRQVGGAKFFRLHGNGVQKLIIQLCGILRIFFAEIGDVQRVIIFEESNPVVLPALAALFQPAKALEHTLCEDDIHISHFMFDTPNVRDGGCTGRSKEILEIHLVQHPLDIGHTDLERGMDVLSTQSFINDSRIFYRDQTLAIKGGNCKIIHIFFYPAVLLEISVPSIRLHGDSTKAWNLKGGIVDHDDPMWLIDFNACHPVTTGHHQTVIGVQLTKLTHPNVQIHHNALTDRCIKIFPDKGKPCGPAHTAGAFKGKITARPSAKVQGDSLVTEHRLHFVLPLHISWPQLCFIKDPLKIHNEKDICQVSDDRILFRECKIIPVKLRHDLKEQGIVFLLGSTGDLALVCAGRVQRKGISAVTVQFCVTNHGSGGEPIDLIFSLKHKSTSSYNVVTSPTFFSQARPAL